MQNPNTTEATLRMCRNDEGEVTSLWLSFTDATGASLRPPVPVTGHRKYPGYLEWLLDEATAGRLHDLTVQRWRKAAHSGPHSGN